MQGPELTDQWEFRKGYISKDRARRATLSALWLVGQECPGMHSRRYGLRLDGTRNLDAFGVPTSHGNEARLNVLCDPRAQDILELTMQTSIETNDTDNGFLVHMYGLAGRMSWHIDNPNDKITDDSLLINTQGHCIVGLKNLEDQKYFYRLSEGDAVYIHNAGPAELRPKHSIWNTGLTRRVGIAD